MTYIEDRITVLEDRVSTLEDIVENDGHKLDELAESFKKLEEEVKNIKSGIKLNNADIFSRLQHISDRVYGVPKTGDEPQVQQTTEEFARIVRCKDCKWYANDIELYDRCRNEDGMFSPSDDDYCSEGEKRNEIN